MRFIIKVKYILQKKFLKQVLCLTLVLTCFHNFCTVILEGEKGPIESL